MTNFEASTKYGYFVMELGTRHFYPSHLVLLAAHAAGVSAAAAAAAVAGAASAVAAAAAVASVAAAAAVSDQRQLEVVCDDLRWRCRGRRGQCQ